MVMSSSVTSIPGLVYNNFWRPAIEALKEVTLSGKFLQNNTADAWHRDSVEISSSDWDLLLKIKWMYSVVIFLLYWLTPPLLFYGIYLLLFRPLNRIRRLGSIGYLQNDDGMSKRDIANMLRKRRKIGQDLPPVFPNGWFRLLNSSQLHSGEVKEITAIGEHFAVYRGSTGQVHILDAYCPHMGGNMAQGGRVEGDCLQCPFHGWTFSGDGKCTDIPYAKKIPHFAKAKSWHSREVNGGIFVWYHCDEAKPTWEIPEIDGIKSGKFTYKGRVEHHANTHIQDVPENGSDLAHLSHLHVPNVLSGTNLSTQFDSWWNFIEHIFKATCEGSTDEKPHISKFFLHHHLLLFKTWKWFHMDLVVYQIGPGMVHLHFTSPFGEGVFVQSLTPVEPLHLVLTHDLYATWRLPIWVAKFFLIFEAIQVDRDVMIWNNKTFSPRPNLVKEDSLIAKYRRWFSQFYSENSPKLKMKSNDTSW